MKEKIKEKEWNFKRKKWWEKVKEIMKESNYDSKNGKLWLKKRKKLKEGNNVKQMMNERKKEKCEKI